MTADNHNFRKNERKIFSRNGHDAPIGLIRLTKIVFARRRFALPGRQVRAARSTHTQPICRRGRGLHARAEPPPNEPQDRILGVLFLHRSRSPGVTDPAKSHRRANLNCHISFKINILTTYPQVAVQPIRFLIESKKLLFCTPVTD